MIDVRCPSCAQTTRESVYWVCRHRYLACSACGSAIMLASAEIQGEADRAEREWRVRWKVRKGSFRSVRRAASPSGSGRCCSAICA